MKITHSINLKYARKPLAMDDLDKLVRKLEENDFSIQKDFFSESEIKIILEDFDGLRASGSFRPAGIGKSSRQVTDIRSDEVSWFDAANLSAGQEVLWRRLTALLEAFNRGLFLGLWNLEGHFAFYPPGGFYRSHLDRFQNDDARTISAVIYLNSDWQKDHGGELVLNGVESGNDLIVEPRAGTLVLFLSDRVWHEVRPSHVLRRSFAGWFRRRFP